MRKRMAKKKKKKRNKRKKKHDAIADDDGEEWRWWWWWWRRWWWWWWGGAFESDAWERVPKQCLKTRSEARPLPSRHSKPQSKALAHAVAKPTPAPPEPPPKIWPQNRVPHRQQSTRRDFEENSKTFKIFQNKESFDWTNFDSSNPKLKSLKSESVKSVSDLQCGFACHRESRHARHIDNLHFVSVHDCGHGSHSGGHNIPICRDVSGDSRYSGYIQDTDQMI